MAREMIDQPPSYEKASLIKIIRITTHLWMPQSCLKSLLIFFFFFSRCVFDSLCLLLGKARRLKQAKEEASAEIEAYRKEREKTFKELEQVVSRKVFVRNLCNM